MRWKKEENISGFDSRVVSIGIGENLFTSMGGSSVSSLIGQYWGDKESHSGLSHQSLLDSSNDPRDAMSAGLSLVVTYHH